MAGPNIPKLNSTNYQSWSLDLKYLLLEKNLWGIVDKSEKAPVLDADKTNASEIEAYKIRSNQALSVIFLNVEPEFKRLIDGCIDPSAAWEKLRLNYCPDTRSQHMKIFSELIESKILPNESVGLFSTRVLRIYNEIKRVDENFDETYASFQVLRYLPRKYDSIVQSILRWKKGDFKFAKITDELVAEETRLKVRDLDSSRNAVQINQINTDSSTKRTFNNVNCWSCGKSGHVQRNCRVRRQAGSKNFGTYRGRPRPFNNRLGSSQVSDSSVRGLESRSHRPSVRGNRRNYSSSSGGRHSSTDRGRSESRDTAPSGTSSFGTHRRRPRRRQTPHRPVQESVHNCSVLSQDGFSDDGGFDSSYMKEGAPLVIKGIVIGSAAHRSGQVFLRDEIRSLKYKGKEIYDPLTSDFTRERTVILTIMRDLIKEEF